MLLELKIRNFVLIDELTLSFDRGLNILTGETGAGKSILIGAISGILGDKMSTDMIRSGYEKASLEALFDISGIASIRQKLDDAGIDSDDDLLTLRREIYSTGRGRSFANGSQVPASKIREIAEYLVDIHGQNEQQSIVKASRHRELLDSFAGIADDVLTMREMHGRLKQIQQKIESFQIDEKEKARRIEFTTFALKEIDAAKLTPGEEESLREESELLSNAEQLFKEINSAAESLRGDDGALSQLRRTEQALSQVSRFDPNISNILETVNEALYSLEDASTFLRDYESGIDFSPERINEVEGRLSLISSLKKKYGDTIDEILTYADTMRDELEAISSSEDQQERLEEEYREVLAQAKEHAFRLSAARLEAARNLEEKVMRELSDLGMAGTEFRVSAKRENSPEGEIESEGNRYVLYPSGLDRVEFMLAANKGEELRQLRRVASGGEMSRIMLALKNVILDADVVESLIFDEVDAGISGKTADMVGKKLKRLSKGRQVLVITHLPQVAAMSDRHYSVQKGLSGERTVTHIKELSAQEKVREVARLLAGEKVTDLSMKHAEEMIEAAQ